MNTPDAIVSNVQAHFADAPFIDRDPGTEDWTDQHFLRARSFSELEKIFKASNDILAVETPGYLIPDDTLAHESQHIDALGTVVESQGTAIEANIGILVARHRRRTRIMHGVGKYTVLPVTIFPKDCLSPLEEAAVFGYPDKPSKTDRLQMKLCGFDSTQALGDAVLSYNTQHPMAPLPVPRSYT